MGSVGRSVRSVTRALTTIKLANGSTAELTQGLTYGRDAGRGEIPQSMQEFEAKRASSKIEFNYLTLADGTLVETNRGGRGSVKASLSARRTAEILSHNHPRSREGILGGTFSPQDIRNFARFNQTTYRAVAGEGTYSITKGANFSNTSDAFVRAFRSFQAQAYAENERSSSAAFMDYRAGNITQAQLNTIVNNNNNNMLINMHNWLSSHQREYGYTYGLEERS